MNILFELLMTFAKIGLFTFGGGYAMLAMVEDICVDKKRWITHEEMMDLIIIAESTPGSVGINCATFTGYKKAGLAGAFVATLGVVLPSFVIIYLISVLMADFFHFTIIANAFKGIKIAVGILIVQAAYNMIKQSGKKKEILAITAASAVLMLCVDLFAWDFSAFKLMIIAALGGIVMFVMNGGDKR